MGKTESKALETVNHHPQKDAIILTRMKTLYDIIYISLNKKP